MKQYIIQAFLLLLFSFNSLNAQNPYFGGPDVYQTSPSLTTYGYIAKDIDGNGYIDFVMHHGGVIEILFSDATGSYSNVSKFDLGIGIYGLTSGDFNNDGKTDLASVTGINALNIITVGFGSGTIPVMSYRTLTTGKDPRYVVSADINNDHYDDVIVSNNSDTSIYVFKNTQTNFTSKRYKVGLSPKMLCVSDFNKDGFTDIAGINEQDNSIFILMNDGSGAYQNPVTYAVGNTPNYIIASDINNDSYPEIIVSNQVSNTISVFGNQNGVFSNSQTFNTGTMPSSILSVDLNNDGNLDIAIPNITSSDIYVYMGSANGTLVFKGKFKTELHPSSLATADFDKDNNPDIISGNIGNGNFSLLKGDGTGNLLIANTYAVDRSYGRTPFAVVPVDINQDQLLDVVAINDNNFAFIKAIAPAQFNAPTNLTTNSTDVTQADINNDGNVDLVGTGNGKLNVLLGKGTGQFDTLYTKGLYGGDIVSGYFNNDFNLDIAIATGNAYISSPNAKISIYLGDGLGKFDSLTTFVTAGGVIRMVSEDFNKDGISDIAVSAWYDVGNSFEVFKGLGTGYFQKTQSTSLGVLNDIKCADVNNDNILDLVTVGSSGGYVMLGTGTCTFTQTKKMNGDIRYITLDDYNNDGKIDYVVTPSYFTSFEVDLGDGKGGIISGASKYIHYSNYFYPVISSDFNNDGLKDIVIAKDNLFYIYLGKGDGDFNTPLNFTSVNTSGVWVSADYNKDNKNDLIVVGNSSNGNDVTLLFNSGQFTDNVKYPTLLTANSGTTTISLTWNDNSDNESKFVIERSNTDAYSGFTILTEVPSNSISYIDATAAPGISYYYKVRAVYGTINSGYSNVANGALPKNDQTITFDPLPSVTYGSADLMLTAQATSGLVITYVSSNPSIAKVVGSTIQILGSGSCTITASQAGNTSYNAAASVQQVLLVNKATLTVTADDKSKNYGDANPVFTNSVSGFVRSDNSSVLTGQVDISISADINSPVGTYDIIITQGSLISSNYNFTFVNGTLNVNKAILIVTADNVTRNFGETNPVFTYSIYGFIGNDNNSLVSGQPVISSLADLNSPVGNYDITLKHGTLSSDNYNFSFVNGTLKVVEVPSPVLVVMQNITSLPSNSGIFDFGDVNVGSNKMVVFTISNTGNADLNISGITSDNSDFIVDNSVTENIIQKGSSTTFIVSFTPHSSGILHGEIKIVSNDLNGDYKIQLNGNGLISTGTIDPLSFKNKLNIYPMPLKGSDGFNVETSETINEIVITNSIGQTELYKNGFINTKMRGILYLQVYTENGVQSQKIYVEY